jgi:hypothetical protein
LSAFLLTACSYNVETLPQCFSEDVPPSLRAIAEVTQSGDYKAGDIEIQHTLCSTHYDRLANAERLLTAAGFRHETRIDELGKCIDAHLISPLTPHALNQQVTTFCGIAAGSRVAYVSWSAMVGEKSVYVSGKYISITRPGELPKPLSN